MFPQALLPGSTAVSGWNGKPPLPPIHSSPGLTVLFRFFRLSDHKPVLCGSTTLTRCMMTAAFPRGPRRFSSVLVLLLLCSSIVPMCAGSAPGNPSTVITPGIGLNTTNLSLTRVEDIPEFTVTPTPLDLFYAELDAETLPGPRYMGFGPSVIGISIDPRLLAACFAVALIALVIWFVSFRNRVDEKKD